MEVYVGFIAVYRSTFQRGPSGTPLKNGFVMRCGYDARMFGSHLSIAGGMQLALLSAENLGFDTVQVFTKNCPITDRNAMVMPWRQR